MEPTPDRGAGAEGGGADKPAPFELAPDEPAVPPRAAIRAESVIEDREESCPQCGTALGPVDVVCVKCGYDLAANEQRRIEKAVEAAEEEPEPFVEPGLGSAKLWAVVGAVLLVGAMVAAGWGTPPGAGAGVVIAAVLLVVYRVLVHTGTGLVAVGIAARINEQPFGGEQALPLAAARVLVAIAAFELITTLLPPLLGTFGKFIGVPLGAAAYWGLVMLLFNKDRTVSLVITLAQVVLWVVVQLGMELSGWYKSALASA